MALRITSIASDYSTSRACCQPTSTGFELQPMATSKRKPLTEDELADAARLKSILLEKKQTEGLTQQAIGLRCGWSGQQAVQAFISGNTPINLDAAFRFSKALDVPLDSISPRLAARAVELFGATLAGQQRPKTFEDVIAAHAEQIAKLNAADRQSIEAMRQSCLQAPGSDEKYTRALTVLLEH